MPVIFLLLLASVSRVAGLEPLPRSLGIFKAHEHAVLSINFDSSRIITGDHYGTEMSVWDASTFKRLEVVQLAHTPDYTLSSLVSSPDRSLAVMAGVGPAAVLNAKTGNLAFFLKGYASNVNGAAFNPDSSLIATAGGDENVRIWSRDGRLLQTLTTSLQPPVGGATFQGVAFNRDGSRLAGARADGTIGIWDTGSWVLRHELRLTGENRDAEAVIFSPIDSRLVTLSRRIQEHAMTLWDTKTGAKLRTWTVNGYGRVPAFSPDGSLLLTASDTGSHISDLAGQIRHVLTTSKVGSVAFSPDGSRAALGYYDGRVEIWQLAYTAQDLADEQLRLQRALRPVENHSGPSTAEEIFKLPDFPSKAALRP